MRIFGLLIRENNLWSYANILSDEKSISDRKSHEVFWYYLRTSRLPYLVNTQMSIQVSTTMAFQQKTEKYVFNTDVNRDFLECLWDFPYPHLILARDWPEISNSVYFWTFWTIFGWKSIYSGPTLISNIPGSCRTFQWRENWSQRITPLIYLYLD